jgi:hypothetical protein
MPLLRPRAARNRARAAIGAPSIGGVRRRVACANAPDRDILPSELMRARVGEELALPIRSTLALGRVDRPRRAFRVPSDAHTVC